jgi:translation initiation factor 6 (eIF-6)
MENDEIDNVRNTNVEIGDKAENELIQLMKHYPSIKKKIPQELKDHSSFKRKIELERTKGRLKITNSSGLFVHDKLSDGPLSHINDMLDVKKNPRNVHARHEQTRRITPQENARASWFSRFRMFGKGTRKNKKKRYGRL